jgi:hypothetical protein
MDIFIAFFCDLARSRPIFMGAVVRVQGKLLGLRMGIMPRGQRRVFMRVVRGMGKRMIVGMMLRIFPVALPVLARPGSGFLRGIFRFGFR